MTYTIRRRELPEVFHYRKRVMGFPVGRKVTEFARPWIVERDGLMVGAYQTEAEAQQAVEWARMARRNRHAD